MCGIAGFVGRGDQSVLVRMTDSIRYRGPDSDGYFFDKKYSVGFGFRRLAIIDLSTGNQPIFNEDKTVGVIFNGEIYNFQQLRKQLESKHVFTTHTDTEVIVHLYEEYGDDVCKYLEGMFAIALWDSKKEKLFLARDRFGEKPLYWYFRDGVFVFASEPKAILAHPAVTMRINTNTVMTYLAYEYAPGEEAFFDGIQKLLPGQYLTLEKGNVRVFSYYEISDHIQALKDFSEDDLLKMLDSRLDSAISSRMVSDVPLGVFLSGGLDSSTVAYYASRHSSRPLETFSIGFREATFDESPWARQVARHLGTNHHEYFFEKKDFFDVLPRVFEKLDEPLADASLLPTYLLSTFTRKRVTVAVGGDGGDELWLGYPTFAAHRLWQLYSHVPKIIDALVRYGINALPVSSAYFSFEFKAKKFLEASHVTDALLRNQMWVGSFNAGEIQKLLGGSMKEAYTSEKIFQDIETIRPLTKPLAPDQALTLLFLKHYLAGDILMKVDRASMFNSLEVRAPFLDSSLAQFVFSLPRKYKSRGMNGKYLLKKLMEPRLGKDIVHRRKQGFSIPLSQWLVEEGRELLDQYLSPKRIRKEEFFNEKYVETLVREHVSKKRDHRKKIWTLLAFQIWREQYNA